MRREVFEYSVAACGALPESAREVGSRKCRGVAELADIRPSQGSGCGHRVSRFLHQPLRGLPLDSRASRFGFFWDSVVWCTLLAVGFTTPYEARARAGVAFGEPNSGSSKLGLGPTRLRRNLAAPGTTLTDLGATSFNGVVKRRRQECLSVLTTSGEVAKLERPRRKRRGRAPGSGRPANHGLTGSRQPLVSGSKSVRRERAEPTGTRHARRSSTSPHGIHLSFSGFVFPCLSCVFFRRAGRSTVSLEATVVPSICTDFLRLCDCIDIHERTKSRSLRANPARLRPNFARYRPSHGPGAAPAGSRGGLSLRRQSGPLLGRGWGTQLGKGSRGPLVAHRCAAQRAGQRRGCAVAP